MVVPTRPDSGSGGGGTIGDDDGDSGGSDDDGSSDGGTNGPGYTEPDYDPDTPASLWLKGAGLTSSSLSQGDSLEARSNVGNSGDEAANGTVIWSVNGSAIASEQKSVGAGETVQFSASLSWADLSSAGYDGESATIEARLTGGRTWDEETETAGSISVQKEDDGSGGPGDGPYIPPDEGGDEVGDDPFEDIPDNQPAEKLPRLQGVGATTTTLSEGDESEIRSQIQNVGDEEVSISISWTVGGEQVGATTGTIGPRSTKRFETTVSWEDLVALGIGESGGTLRAKLSGGPSWDQQTETGGTVSAAGADDSNSDDSDPTGTPAWAVVPPIGKYSAEQSTIGAAVAAIVLLGVIR